MKRNKPYNPAGRAQGKDSFHPMLLAVSDNPSVLQNVLITILAAAEERVNYLGRKGRRKDQRLLIEMLGPLREAIAGDKCPVFPPAGSLKPARPLRLVRPSRSAPSPVGHPRKTAGHKSLRY